MPKTFCGPSCNQLVTPGTHCPDCQQRADTQASIRRARATTGRPTTTARGYGSVYQRRRKQLIAAAIRDGSPCAICGQPCEHGQPIVAHHPDGNPAGADPRTCRLEPAHKACNDGYRAPSRSVTTGGEPDAQPWVF